MTNCAAQPKRFGVVTLIKNLAYLHGYKSAVFDSHFRFTRPKDPEAIHWKYEERVLNEIATVLWSVLEKDSLSAGTTCEDNSDSNGCNITVSAESVTKALGDYLADISAHNSEDSPYFECATQTVERLLASPSGDLQKSEINAKQVGMDEKCKLAEDGQEKSQKLAA